MWHADKLLLWWSSPPCNPVIPHSPVSLLPPMLLFLWLSYRINLFLLASWYGVEGKSPQSCPPQAPSSCSSQLSHQNLLTCLGLQLAWLGWRPSNVYLCNCSAEPWYHIYTLLESPGCSTCLSKLTYLSLFDKNHVSYEYFKPSFLVKKTFLYIFAGTVFGPSKELAEKKEMKSRKWF